MIKFVISWAHLLLYTVLYTVLLFSLCLVISGFHLLSSSTNAEKLSPIEKARLEEVLNLREQLGESLWQGFGKAKIPIIVYNEKIAFLIGLDHPSPGWKKVPSGIQKGNKWEKVEGDFIIGKPYYYQLIDSNNIPEAFIVKVGNIFVASITSSEMMIEKMGKFFAGNTDFYITLLIHESFHTYQAIVAQNRLYESENILRKAWDKYPWNDIESNRTFKKEINLLLKAYTATSKSESIKLIKEYLESQKARFSQYKFDSSSIRLEQLREWEEGLAKYTEMAIYKLVSSHSRYRSVLSIHNDPNFDNYKKFSPKWQQEMFVLQNQPQGDEVRFYYSGMIKAFLLDKLNPGWKKKGLKRLLLDDLLREIK